MRVKELKKVIKTVNKENELKIKNIDLMNKQELEAHIENFKLRDLKIDDIIEKIEDVIEKIPECTLGLKLELKAKNSKTDKLVEPVEKLNDNVEKYKAKRFRVNQNGIYVDVTIRKCGTLKAESAFIIENETRLFFRVRDFKYIRQIKKNAVEILKEVLNDATGTN